MPTKRISLHSKRSVVSKPGVTFHIVYSDEVFKALCKRRNVKVVQKRRKLEQAPHDRENPDRNNKNCRTKKAHKTCDDSRANDVTTHFDIDIEELEDIEREMERFPAHVRQLLAGKLDKPKKLRPQPQLGHASSKPIREEEEPERKQDSERKRSMMVPEGQSWKMVAVMRVLLMMKTKFSRSSLAVIPEE